MNLSPPTPEGFHEATDAEKAKLPVGSFFYLNGRWTPVAEVRLGKKAAKVFRYICADQPKATHAEYKDMKP